MVFYVVGFEIGDQLILVLGIDVGCGMWCDVGCILGVDLGVGECECGFFLYQEVVWCMVAVVMCWVFGQVVFVQLLCRMLWGWGQWLVFQEQCILYFY